MVIIVFDAIYMLLPLYVLCSKKNIFSSLHSSTPHNIGAKRLNLGFFCPHVCGLSHFEDLIRF